MHKQLPLTAIATLSLFAAFGVQLLILTQIGAGAATDAYFAALVVPQLSVAMVSVALSAVLVPIFSGYSQQRQRSDAWQLVYLVAKFATVFSLLLFLLAPFWVRGLFPGFSEPTKLLCEHLARIQVLAIPPMLTSAVAVAGNYARERFLYVELVELTIITLALAILWLTLGPFGIEAAAWVFVARSLARFLLLASVFGHPTRATQDSPLLREMWQRMKPILAGNAYFKSDAIVDRYLLSMGAPGEVSLFGLSQQIYQAGAGLLGKIWGSTAIPRLSTLNKSGDRAGFYALYRARLRILLLISGAVYVLIVLVGEPVLAVVIGHGKLGAEEIALLWRLMVFLGGIFIFRCSGVILYGAFYAVGETKIPSYMSMASFTLFIVIKVAAFHAYGIVGICLAASLHYLTNACLLFLLFRWRFPLG